MEIRYREKNKRFECDSENPIVHSVDGESGEAEYADMLD